MVNPVLVEVTRGTMVESAHRGALAIVDADGRTVFSMGDVLAPVYPRSSLKPVQALPLVESGAADAFGLGDDLIALAAASHSGEPMHTERVAEWLGRIGFDASDLACGPQPPRYEPVWDEMIRRGEKPTPIHNNCSGKHAGFLTVARHWNVSGTGYERHDHPVQQAVARALGELAELEGALPWGVDGCAAPNFALPLYAFAHAIAKFASPHRLPSQRAQAARRIVQAMTAYPELVAGTDRVCTTLMRGYKGRVAVKTGAEGVFAAIIPECGLGIALKIDDGAGRAAETAIAAVLNKLIPLDDEAIARIICAPVRNTRNTVVGGRRPSRLLEDAAIRAA